MSLRIIIDGYNLIKQSPLFRSADFHNLSGVREKLIERLALYRMVRGNPLVVVFDGWQEGHATEQRTKEKGIDIIYSQRGETADEVIKRLVTHAREELVVVTSDREINDFCQSRKCEVIPSPLFEERVERCCLARMKGLKEDDGETMVAHSTKKKGPSRKLPKSMRRRLQRLKKL
jgi:predicted RNA-binding protein with PIN domain